MDSCSLYFDSTYIYIVLLGKQQTVHVLYNSGPQHSTVHSTGFMSHLVPGSTDIFIN